MIPANLTISSTLKLSFLFPVCAELCMRAPRFVRMQSMNCKAHSRHLHNNRRPKYDGPIPLHIRRPIRAGLLLGVDRNQLCSLVTSMEPIKNAENPVFVATSFIEHIAQYDRACLADNCFWGDDSSVRRNGVRVPHKKPQKRHRVSQDNDLGVPDTDQPQTVYINVTTRSGFIGVSCTYCLRHCCFCYCLQDNWLQMM